MSLTHLHHIQPRHMGGSDDPSNLVELTVEDHAIAHKVLYGLYGRWQDRVAWLALSGRITSEEAIRETQRNVWLGKKLSEEHRKKMSLAKIGTKKSDKTKEKIRSYRHTDEAKINISKNHAFKNGRPGHSERMSGENNPAVALRGKSWVKDPVTGKRIWVEKTVGVY